MISKNYLRQRLNEANLALSMRGWLFLAALLWLIFVPVKEQSDIVAAMLSLCMLILLLSLASVSLFRGKAISQTLKLQLSSEADATAEKSSIIQAAKTPSTQPAISGEPTLLVFKIPSLSLPPFFRLEIKILFQYPEIESTTHRISGAFSHARFFSEQIIFPHRGNWQISGAECVLKDRFGLSQYRWQVSEQELKGAFYVCPPTLAETDIPIYSSTRKAGDSLNDINERQGELFDLKPYHPSDGMRRILWKVFARSNELISRHPERSMSPEGHVLLFCLADAHEDHVCSNVISYIKQLQELDLELSLGCKGMKNQNIARTQQQALALLVETAWASLDSAESSQIKDEVAHFIEKAKQSAFNSNFENIVIFFATEKISSKAPNYYQEIKKLITLAEQLESQQIRPIFVSSSKSAPGISSRKTVSPSKFSRVKRWLSSQMILTEGPATIPAAEIHPDFIKACANRDWEHFCRASSIGKR